MTDERPAPHSQRRGPAALRAAAVLLASALVPTGTAAASGATDPPVAQSAPRLVQLHVGKRVIRPTGAAVPLRFRIARGKGPVRLRVALTPVAGGDAVATTVLRARRPGPIVRTRWRLGSTAVPPGDYRVTLMGVDRRREPLVVAAKFARRATLTVAAPAPTADGVFPVAGRFRFWLDGGGFGADRGDHAHQGQDVAAAEGTPIVNPVAGTVIRRAYQASGAGHYVVVRGASDGRDRVFMHMKSGALVARGQPVAAGQAIGVVGSTGRSSGAHLHYEHWVGGWQQPGGYPIDPLPELRAWAARGATSG